jgi:CheY-like chemotaxis protein
MRILLVDDQFQSRWAVADWLAVFLHSVAIESAASGNEALTMHDARKADLVLAAHPMAGMDGLALTRRLKSRRDAPLVAVMADTVNAQLEALCEAAGADFWLEKRHLQARFLGFLQQRFSLRLARQGFLP